MNISFWILLVAGITTVLALKRFAFVNPTQAGEFLRRGAAIIDVRSSQEYQRGHLPGAINVPLSQLRADIQRHLPDPGQTVLLHCLSGGRSGMAKGILQKMGYRNAHNLGSYGRAEKILMAHRPELFKRST